MDGNEKVKIYIIVKNCKKISKMYLVFTGFTRPGERNGGFLYNISTILLVWI